MNKMVIRIFAILLILTMVLGLGAPLFSLVGRAVETPDINTVDGIKVLDSNGNAATYIRQGNTYDIEYYYSSTHFSSGATFYSTRGKFNLSNSWQAGSSAQVRFRVSDTVSTDGSRRVDVKISNIRYDSSNRSNNFTLDIRETPTKEVTGNQAISVDYQPKFDFDINSGYFTAGGNNTSVSDDDGEAVYTPDIVFESVRVLDKNEKLLEKIDKNTAPFSVEIIYSDYGLISVDPDDIYRDNLEVYATDFGGFVPSTGTRGTLTKITSLSKNDAPRFRIRFNNLTHNGGGATIAYRVQYDILGELIKGSGSANVYQALSSDDKNEIPPPTPYIIISKYSYGSEDIVAGNTFDLNVSYQNTSDDIPLENIVMTVNTPEEISIASASNTVFVRKLGAGATLNHTVALQARPSASVGSKSVQIDFTYQYTWNNERKDGKTSESIAIPLTQIDRFALDPITEMSDYALMGEQFYVTISFTNKGKSSTYNISATAKSNLDMLAVPVHYGNLDAGKNDSVDVMITAHESGEMVGELIVQYEDENNNQKELSMPFTMYIEKPYDPAEDPNFNPYPNPGDDMSDLPPERSNAAFALYISGGLLIAFALAYYMAKRTKKKESNDFDEDF